MSKVVKTQLVWKYEPKDFFEQPVSIDYRGWDITIEDGEAVALIQVQDVKFDEVLKKEMTLLIMNQFQSVQLNTHRDFELGDCVRTDFKEDGSKNAYGGAHATIHLTPKSDFVKYNHEGKITFDSKKERLRDQDKLASLINKYRGEDQILNHILNFFNDARSDPKNELVHLYNIRDSLIDRFGPKKKFLKILSIDKGDYNRFGKLTNVLPLNQGRHKGQAVGNLRDATQSELSEARRLAVKFIRSYLHYLDGND